MKALTYDHVLWHEPDGHAGIIETVEFLTQVAAAWNGAEQRVSLRDEPVGRLTVTYVLEAQAARQLLHELNAWLADRWAVPLWQHAMPAAWDIEALAPSLSADTTRYYVESYSHIALWQRGTVLSRNPEIVETTTVTSSLVSFDTGPTQDWNCADGAFYLIPVKVCRLDGPPAVRQVTPDLLEVELSWVQEGYRTE